MAAGWVPGRESVSNLYLDPRNPRLGRHNIELELSQDKILDEMLDWSLEELGVSLLESGFWPQEALICVEETIPGKKSEVLVVVEGNRRLAALKLIEKAREGQAVPRKWVELIQGYKTDAFKRLEKIDYILIPSRKEALSYIGYRHVTGIKEWKPAEKAEFIAKLIEEEKLTYDQVRKRIGSKTPTVRQNYISYRVLLQMEDREDIDLSKVEKRFSVLFLSLRTNGVQTYLDIDIEADTKAAKTPVPKDKLDCLTHFARWLFGTEEVPPLIADSRQVEDFGRMLESPETVDYLERSDRPSFAVAKRMAGVAESDVAQHIELAADELGEALKAVHQHKGSKRVQRAVKRMGMDALQILDMFPAQKKEIQKTLVEEE